MGYLSPDAQQDLEDFNPDDIFIIGGLVDKRMKRFCSLQRANKAGVRCAKFPLQDNARVIAAKPMNFLEVLTILHRFTYHKDIHRAIVEGISPRRIRKPEQAQTWSPGKYRRQNVSLEIQPLLSESENAPSEDT